MITIFLLSLILMFGSCFVFTWHNLLNYNNFIQTCINVNKRTELIEGLLVAAIAHYKNNNLILPYKYIFKTDMLPCDQEINFDYSGDKKILTIKLEIKKKNKILDQASCQLQLSQTNKKVTMKIISWKI